MPWLFGVLCCAVAQGLSTPVSYQVGGIIGEYVSAVTEQWLLTMPGRNVNLTGMFHFPGAQPAYLPWSGEFAGKYLIGAVQVLRLTNDTRLADFLQTNFVPALLAGQDHNVSDAYLGPFAIRFDPSDWDTWGHYHVMFGLLEWYKLSGDVRALNSAKLMGDMMCNRFLAPNSLLHSMAGNSEMNQAVIHSMLQLYQLTTTSRYLTLALQIAAEFSMKDAAGVQCGDYINCPLAGNPFYACPKPRWESINTIMSLPLLQEVTGNTSYGAAFQALWWSLVQFDRHDNGGVTTNEGACGDPYKYGSIETCATVAWTYATFQMLNLTGDAVVADELELSTLNQVLGYQFRNGSLTTYNTPMDGVRIPNIVDIKFQVRPGTEEVNCCSANAPRGFGVLSEWAVMRNDTQPCGKTTFSLSSLPVLSPRAFSSKTAPGCSVVVNFYAPMTVSVDVGNGNILKLTQKTRYPRDGVIQMELSLQQPAIFQLALRIPCWSRPQHTAVYLNDQPMPPIVASGEYYVLDGQWPESSTVAVTLDMSLRFWAGENEAANKTAVYYGPVLMAFQGPTNTPRFDASTMDTQKVVGPAGEFVAGQPLVTLEVPSDKGNVILESYGTVGANEAQYFSWLNVANVQAAPFSRENPTRTWHASP